MLGIVCENFEIAGIRVAEQRFAAKDMILRRRSRRKDRDQGTATTRRGLIEMISGDEDVSSNGKPRLTITLYGLTATSGIKDVKNGGETIWVEQESPARRGDAQGLRP
jgi:hypothetical protein